MNDGSLLTVIEISSSLRFYASIEEQEALEEYLVSKFSVVPQLYRSTISYC
jgi:hypothetical protein